MKGKMIPSLLVAAMAMASCVTGTDNLGGGENQNQQQQIRFSTSVSVHSSRAAYTAADMQIPAGEQVHVWIDRATEGTELYGRTAMTTDGNGNLSGGDAMFFPIDGSNVNIYALHTNATLSGTGWPASALAHTVAADQTTLAGYAASDLLYARLKNVAQTDNAIPVTFSHLLSKLRVAIVLGEGVAAGDIASVSIGGIKGGAELTLDKTTASGSLAVSATGAVQNVAVGADVSADFDAPNFNDAIIVPQTVAAGITFVTIKLTSGEELIYRLNEETTFESGKKYALNMTVSQNGVALETKSEDWEAGEGIDGTVSPDNGTLVKGTTGTLTWKVSTDGTLTITGEGDMPDYGAAQTRSTGAATPWSAHAANIENVVIGEGVTSVGASAFTECVALTSATLSASVTTIGDNAFNGCEALESVITPAGLPELGENVFGSSAVNILAFEGTVGSLTWRVFWNGSLWISGTGRMMDYGDPFYTLAKRPWHNYRDDIWRVVIESGVISLGENAFSDFSKLTNVDIRDGGNLVHLKNAFVNCEALSSIKIPASAQRTLYPSFMQLLKDLPFEIEFTEEDPYYMVVNGIFCTKDETQQIIKIGAVPYDYNFGVSSYIIPNSVTEIWSNAFDGCTKLFGVVIPQGVKLLNSYTFSNCPVLMSVDIPASVTEIEDDSFFNCPHLSTVTCRAIQPPKFTGKMNFATNTNDTLHVPADSVDAYKADAQWSAAFTNIVAI